MGLLSRTWRVKVDGASHRIELRSGLLGRTWTVLVDGQVARAPGVDGETLVGADLAFELDGTPCQVRLRGGGGPGDARLVIAGRDVETGQRVGDDLRQDHAVARVAFSLMMVATGVVLWLLRDRLRISGQPAHYLGFFVGGMGVLGLLGFNVFRGGPLDPRAEEPPPPAPPPRRRRRRPTAA